MHRTLHRRGCLARSKPLSTSCLAPGNSLALHQHTNQPTLVTTKTTVTVFVTTTTISISMAIFQTNLGWPNPSWLSLEISGTGFYRLSFQSTNQKYSRGVCYYIHSYTHRHTHTTVLRPSWNLSRTTG